MNITWYWGTDSSCPNYYGINSSVTNGTYSQTNDNNFSSYDTTYYWKVVVNDGHGGWTNETYHFTTISANKKVISKGRSAYSLEIGPDGDTLYGYIDTTTSVSASINTSWHYVALTFDGSTLTLYKDGVSVDTASGSMNTNENNLTLGEYLTGTLDEIRISNTARSGAWINTTYQNQNDPSSFATFGSQVGILSTWSYRKKIWINASMIDTDLTNFPVLISTTDNDLKNNALSNGYDILFTNSSVSWTTGSHTDKLAHEIERYNSSTGELIAWVNVTSLSSTTNTTIYMYYGNSLCTANRQNPTGVWDSNFVMVQHLNETADPHEDSTSYNNDGNESGGVNQSATEEKIDGADWFDGNDDYVNCKNDSSLDFDNQNFTIEMWVKPEQQEDEEIASKKVDAAYGKGYAMRLYFYNGNLHPLFHMANGTHSNNIYQLNYDIFDGNWHYLVGVVNASTKEGFLYDDGAVVQSLSNIACDGMGNTVNLTIGTGVDYGNYTGSIDEVRISNTVRNTSWIKTIYNNINDTANFTTFGSQEIPNVAPTQSSPSPSDGATGQSLNPTLSIQVNDTNLDSMNVTFRTNATGTWGTIGYNASVGNGTYSQTNSSMNSYSTKYWWSVNVTDDIAWSNQTYSFTTENQALTLTIRPNATGRSTQLSQQPNVGQHWAKVDEVTQNGDTDFVYSSCAASFINDTYNLTDHTTETGTINNITIYLCGKDVDDPFACAVGADPANEMKPVIYTNNQYYDSDTEVALTTSYVTSSWNYVTNPITSSAWTWSEIDALEVGVALKGEDNRYSNCTQVYVEVNYTSASPYIYTYKDQKFTKISDFIPGAISPDKEYTQFIDITEKIDIINGKVRLKITEELDETTYLDRIYLKINSDQIIELIIELDTIRPTTSILKSLTERGFLSQINKQRLKQSDDQYLIMKQGDEYFLEFKVPTNYQKIEFVAEGYYIKHSSEGGDYASNT
jgi:hypothetical protein